MIAADEALSCICGWTRGDPGPAGNAIRKRDRSKTIEKWQERWSKGTKGSWTRELIPVIATWLQDTVTHTLFQCPNWLTQSIYTERITEVKLESHNTV